MSQFDCGEQISASSKQGAAALVVPLPPFIMVNFEQTCLSRDGTVETVRLREGVMTSIVPFISNAVFEPADIRLMSYAYSKAIEAVYSFGRPNKVVGRMIADRIVTLTNRGERDPNRLRDMALAACGFDLGRGAG